MNIFILKVMRQMDNPELFTKDEIRKNASDAHTIAAAAYAADVDYDVYAADAADATAYATAYATTYATTYAQCIAVAYAAVTNYWFNRYFKETNEDRQDYINEVERLK